MKTFAHELIICIVNEGFSDLVMDTARDVGARGGTVVSARGTANKEAEKLFCIDIQPQKEMVMIVVPTELRDDVMHALYNEVGLNTPGQGIAFAMPIDNVVGISTAKPEITDENENVEEKTGDDDSEAAMVNVTEENIEDNSEKDSGAIEVATENNTNSDDKNLD